MSSLVSLRLHHVALQLLPETGAAWIGAKMGATCKVRQVPSQGPHPATAAASATSSLRLPPGWQSHRTTVWAEVCGWLELPGRPRSTHTALAWPGLGPSLPSAAHAAALPLLQRPGALARAASGLALQPQRGAGLALGRAKLPAWEGWCLDPPLKLMGAPAFASGCTALVNSYSPWPVSLHLAP